MQGAIDYMRGKVRVNIRMEYPERFVNICAQNGVEFWDAVCAGKTVSVTVSMKSMKKLTGLSEHCGFELVKAVPKGMPVEMRKIKKRYALIVGLVICIALVWVSSLFVWDIEVYGNEKVSREAILGELEKLGVEVGMCRLFYDQSVVSNEMLLKLTDLSWITVNIKGSRAEVLVREERPKPEMYDENRVTEIYAKKSGIITDMVVENGKKLVELGDTVDAGDILVTGAMDSISRGVRYVNSKAEIYARTWYTLSISSPVEIGVKEYTGERTVRSSLMILGKRINLYFNGGKVYDDCDKIINEKVLTLPGGNILPIKLVTEEYVQYTRKDAVLKTEMLVESMEECIKEKILSSIDGEISDITFSYLIDDGILIVTAFCECREQIAEARDMSPDFLENNDTGDTANND